MENPLKNAAQKGNYSLDSFQKIALGGMLALTLLTFVGANLHAVLWQSSRWLVSTVLPAVVIDMTNDERADIAAAPLRRSAVLDEAARLKAQHMAKNEYFSHYAPDGTSPWYWFDTAGYSYAHAGENLAIHFTDSSEVVGAWMNSPTHRANIVNGVFTEIGVGTAKGEYEGYDTVYVVQLFGTPAQAPVVKTTPAPAPRPAPVLAVADPVPVRNDDQAVLAVTEDAVPEEVTALEEVSIEPEIVTEPNPASEPVIISEPADVVVVEMEPIATSSGLAVATFFEEPVKKESRSLVSLITKPNSILQIVYLTFGAIVVILLATSVIFEARHKRYVQMCYGLGLLAIMVVLWYVHSLLTMGAVIV